MPGLESKTAPKTGPLQPEMGHPQERSEYGQDNG